VLTESIQTVEVVATAAIVPTGIDLCASARSPDLFDPAMIPADNSLSLVAYA